LASSSACNLSYFFYSFSAFASSHACYSSTLFSSSYFLLFSFSFSCASLAERNSSARSAGSIFFGPNSFLVSSSASFFALAAASEFFSSPALSSSLSIAHLAGLGAAAFSAFFYALSSFTSAAAFAS